MEHWEGSTPPQSGDYLLYRGFHCGCTRFFSSCFFAIGVLSASTSLSSYSPEDDDGDESPPSQPASSAPGRWSRPRMPEGLLQIMRGALVMLMEPAAQCRAIAPHLTQSQVVSLVNQVTMLAALELSGFSLLPYEVLPARRRASEEYVDLSRSLLGISPERPGSGDMSILLYVIQGLGKPVRKRFKADPGEYEQAMIRQLRLFQTANTNVIHILRILLDSVSPETGMIPDASFEQSLKILKAIYDVRCRQTMSSFYTRYALDARRKRVSTWIFFHFRKLKKWLSSGVGPVADETKILLDAIKSAGGDPVSVISFDVADDAESEGEGTQSPGDGVQHGSESGGASAQGEGDQVSGQTSQEVGEVAAPLLPGASQTMLTMPSTSGTQQHLTGPAYSTGSAHLGVGSFVEDGVGEGQQASLHDLSLGEGAAGAFGATPSTSAGSASAFASGFASTSGQMGAIGGDGDDGLLQLIEQSIDWEKAIAEEEGDEDVDELIKQEIDWEKAFAEEADED
ncbi:hypothetical protein Emed_004228 [Eimeria media]